MTGMFPMAAACGVAAVIKLHNNMAMISNLSPPNLSEIQEENGNNNKRLVSYDSGESSEGTKEKKKKKTPKENDERTIIRWWKNYLPIDHLALVSAHSHPKKHSTLHQRTKNPNEMQPPSEWWPWKDSIDPRKKWQWPTQREAWMESFDQRSYSNCLHLMRTSMVVNHANGTRTCCERWSMVKMLRAW